MTIQEGNIRLLKSQVMDDVPEGGGRATGLVVVDGTSNSLFPDISELDRAGGRVNLRKAFVGVNTADTDGYFGVNVVISDPPDDPRVSCTLFTTNDTFDKRIDAQSRLESYLAVGPIFPALLFSNHLAGQRTMTLIARNEQNLPVVGQTMVLNSQTKTQYVRLTSVAVQKRTFEDEKGAFDRVIFTVGLSDPLRYDFGGFAALRYDPDIALTPTKAAVYDTVVADAARYYGVTPLTVPANLGDFSAIGENTYTSLVPSAQVETPIADARMNQQAVALTSAGGPLVQVINAAFTPTQAFFIGGAVLPGSLTVVRSGITLADVGGKLVNQATLAEVGAIDYQNGVMSLVTDVWGATGGQFTITYDPAGKATVISQSFGVPITAVSQRLTYAITLNPPPAKASLNVSYLSGGRWYVLTEDGSGRVSGSNSAIGVGNLNFQTGTVSLTLGALPDEGSEMLLSWAPAGGIVRPNALPTTLSSAVLSNRFFTYIPMVDNDGKPKTLTPGTISITWDDAGVARTATDLNGSLVGDAVGLVQYSIGVIRFSPNTLPPVGTAINVAVGTSAMTTVTVPNFLDGGANWTGSIGSAIRPKTVDMAIIMQFPVRQYPGTDITTNRVTRCFDDGNGNLQIANVSENLTIGTVNYTDGSITLTKSLPGLKDIQTVYKNTTPMDSVAQVVSVDGTETRILTGAIVNGAGAIGSPGGNIVWQWWVGANLPGSASVRFGDTGSTGDGRSIIMNNVWMSGRPYRFSLGADNYVQGTNLGTSGYGILKNPSPATGEGTPVGQVSYTYDPNTNRDDYNSGPQYRPIGSLRLDEWAAGVSPLATNFSEVWGPTLNGPTTNALISSLTVRSAIAPIRNNSYSIYCLTEDGTILTATSNEQGFILGGSGSKKVWGKINYATGVVKLVFGAGSIGALVDGAIDVTGMGLPGGITQVFPSGVRADTLRYNASAYTYLPLSADLLGLDPVRLPSDGKVPIFRSGSFAVISHTAKRNPSAVSNGQTIDLGRTRLSRIRVVGNDKVLIPNGYTTDLDAGTITFNDVTGYSMPVTIENRIEDMMLVSDAQLGGRLTFTRPLTHDYPLGSFLSSALVIGDMRSRVSTIFDQGTWNATFSDLLSGAAAVATYNDALTPLLVTNAGALTERWALQFTGSTSFNIIGEHVGIIGTGSTAVDCAPPNIAAGNAPYFTVKALGWGAGWTAGNVLRFNTVGALFPVWIARTIQQGPATAQSDSFTLLVRGDIDRP